jgi:hypothetical protein
MAPGLVVWLAITSPLWGAVLAPQVLGFFLVLFSAYWLVKSIIFAWGVVVGYVRLEQAQRRDWYAAAAALPGFSRLRHLVLIPTYQENEEILADTLHHLAMQDVPLNRVAVVLAFEERDPAAPARARHLQQRFGALFGELLVTFHPDLPGEVKGKSSNLAWAARRVEEELVKTGRLSPHHLLVTVCDADSRLHRGYLAALSYATLSHQDGPYHVFQPAILFYANHWRLPAPLRAINSVYSLYELSRMVPSHRLVTQSTYSLSWTAAHGVGFWDTDVIPEDSRLFFKVFVHFGQRVKVRPIFLPVYADAAEGRTLGATVVNSYQQILRWAWGVSDVPYVVLGALRARHIPWHIRAARVAWYVEEHLVWPSHWFLLMLGGSIPPLVNPDYARSALGLWQAGLTSAFLGFCMPCLAVVIFADWRLRPEHPEGEDLFDVLKGWAAFALLPIVSLPLAAAPALDAHTRLLFGRYLEYRVTEKVPVTAHIRGERLSRPSAVDEQALQHRSYPAGSAASVTDPVLVHFSDLG